MPCNDGAVNNKRKVKC